MNTCGRIGSLSDSLRSISSARSSAWPAPSASSSAIRAATMMLSGPMCMVRSSSRASTPGCDSISPRISFSTAGLAARPMSSSLLSIPSLTATTISSTPIAMDALPSQTGEPVSWLSPTPRPAITRPTTAALSSNRATLTVMSGLVCTWESTSSWPRRASPRTCQKARANERPLRHEGDAKRHVGEQHALVLVAGQREYALEDGESRAGDEDAERREQRPEVPLLAVPERVLAGRRAGPPGAATSAGTPGQGCPPPSGPPRRAWRSTRS